MNPEDTASEVVPLFDKYWEKTLRKTQRYFPACKTASCTSYLLA